MAHSGKEKKGVTRTEEQNKKGRTRAYKYLCDIGLP